ncbi:MAG: hypothetical protein WC543_00175 [Candidatus Omnitrophota bacterium]
MSVSIEFEHWIRFTLPKHLYLSESKQAAMNSIFYHFSDSVKSLENKAPKEFNTFFLEMKRLVKRVNNKKCPSGYFIWEGSYREKPKIKQSK